jgi:hypothetical protein
VRVLSVIIITLLCLAGAPLLGIYLSGKPVEGFLEFPPVTTLLTIDHAPFSWPAFFIILALVLLTVMPFIRRVVTYSGISRKSNPRQGFPAWGWTGLLIMAAGWILAWSRFPFFSQWQTHTFTIPWAGYIILVNALAFMRSGRSMITHEPVYLGSLFLFSAIFWWYFEFLNQFVQNWYYVNTGSLGRLEFFLYGTLPFSTVLPAVIGTKELLQTFPRLSRGLDDFYRVRIRHPRRIAFAGGLFAVAGLSLTAIRPDHFFPMLWLAPLVIIAAAVVINGERGILTDLSRGDWRAVYLLALSALICGFFWEMWNYHSLTRWEYSVPLVDRFRIFEMPVLGYAGYLPFGLQCGLAAWLIKRVPGVKRVSWQ